MGSGSKQNPIARVTLGAARVPSHRKARAGGWFGIGAAQKSAGSKETQVQSTSDYSVRDRYSDCSGDNCGQSSATRDFCSQEEKQAFRVWLGRHIEKHHSSFFVALDADGRAVGYLAGCLENPMTLSHFNDVAYSAPSRISAEIILRIFM